MEEGYTKDNWFPITNYYNDAYSPLDDISQYDYQLPFRPVEHYVVYKVV